MLALAAPLILSLLGGTRAQITVLGQIPLAQMTTGTATTTAVAAAQTTLGAYNDTTLQPPQLPDPAPANQFTLELPQASSDMIGLSIPHNDGSLWGFSIEMSVTTQVLGKNSSFIPPPFLNLLSNIVERAGKIGIRIGGNSQERAELVGMEVIPDGRSMGKERIESNATTETPAVVYNMDFFYMLGNVSSLLPGVGWYLGIPFNQTQPFRLQIAENAEAILGENLLGLQAGNEPDFYLNNGHRIAPYTPYDYFGEVGDLVEALNANDNVPTKNNLIAPSVMGVDGINQWTPEMVWDTGFLEAYSDHLKMLSVEHYPDNNCEAVFGDPSRAVNPQDVFGNYLTHRSGQGLVAPYLNTTMIAQNLGKPVIIFETNTASCGGFHGISDSFGATLWALDYGLQLAHGNLTHGLLHVGGQNNFYNAFTAPPTNQSSFNEWSVGAVFYSVLAAAEVFGKSETAQIMDLQGNNGSEFTPQYAVYDNGNLDKVALFNYMDDPSGEHAYTATIHVNGGQVPENVAVKYLLSDSVSTKNNITWAGQTFGTTFNVDGRLKGELNIVNVPCDRNANTCSINVPAPGFALVFFDSGEPEEIEEPQTYSTSAVTRTRNTATVNPSVLATSNGHSGADREMDGSTSPQENGATRIVMSVALAGVLMVAGAVGVMAR